MVSSQEFAAKYRSKREIYNFLACDVGIFLPPYENITIYFLKDLMSGRKKMLRTTMIRTIHIPQYVKTIIEGQSIYIQHISNKTLTSYSYHIVMKA